MTRIRWRVVTGITLGVLLGIYAASCGEDNKPEAAAIRQQFDVTVNVIDAYKDVRVYRLAFGDGTSAMLGIDDDLPFAQFLREHKKVRVILEPK